jgi:pimeloyl-ACP methyl ester carboxylesterase
MNTISSKSENVQRRRRRFAPTVLACALLQLGALGLASSQANAAEVPASTVGTITPGSHTSFGPLKHVKAGLLDVAYAEVGPADGPVVILLHGWPYDPLALASDLIDFMDALNIKQAVLGGYDWGARTADIVAALWPERVKALVAVSGYLIGSQEAGKAPLSPAAELQWWYQFYFATERGRLGYEKNTHDFAKLIWKLASPKWSFDDATFDRSAAALQNPDHVAVSIYNYRWRLGLLKGEAKYAGLEKKLATFPSIAVPTITLEGDANGAPHPPAEAYAKRFTGKYQYRLIDGGVGHNLPQEAPQAFAQAVIDADHL